MEDKTDEKTWTSREMKTTIRALKIDSDGKVPTLKKDIVAYYKCIIGWKDNAIVEYNEYNFNGAMKG